VNVSPAEISGYISSFAFCALPGTDQVAWGEKEVDIAGEIAQALVLMEPPVSASRPQVEQAIVAARGKMADVVQVSAE
jgi:hypothetical protein